MIKLCGADEKPFVTNPRSHIHVAKGIRYKIFGLHDLLTMNKACKERYMACSPMTPQFDLRYQQCWTCMPCQEHCPNSHKPAATQSIRLCRIARIVGSKVLQIRSDADCVRSSRNRTPYPVRILPRCDGVLRRIEGVYIKRATTNQMPNSVQHRRVHTLYTAVSHRDSCGWY